VVYPIYYTIIASFSDHTAVATGKISLLPVGFQTTAYEAVFKNTEIWLGYLNTILYTVGGTAFNLFLTIPAAYAMSKKRMFGHGVLSWYFLITMYFGGGMIPTYLLYKTLNLVNNPFIMVISGGISVYNMIVTRTYYQNSIPESLYEAGRIDGCSEIGMFFRIALPLSLPIVAVMCLYYAVGHWNGYFTALIYLTKTRYQPLALVLRRILIMNQAARDEAVSADLDPYLIANAAARANLVVVMKYALVIIASLPMLILYPFIQKYFVKGVMIGSVKG
jgi:putative aldouronate transport system permease protein